MRILSLGFPLPGPGVDNHDFLSAPVFFDYDAIIVDPKALSQLIQDAVAGRVEKSARSGVAIVNGPGGADSVSLADVLRARRHETERLLARGGVVVCFPHPNAAHPGVDGFSECDRYYWLPAPDGVTYGEPLLRAGAGSEIGEVEVHHAFGPYLERFRGKLAYHAYFEDAASGSEGAVFARSAGGAAIGVSVGVGAGSVVFVPQPAKPPTGEQRYALSESLQGCIRRALGLAARGKPPGWAAEYALPGLQVRLEGRQESARALEQASAAWEAAEAAADELERYRRLLWQEGRYGLEEPVRGALALLGFDVLPRDIDAPAYVRLAGQPAVALLEVEAGEGAIGLEGHYRLRRRLEEAIAQGRPKRGLLVINGHRRLPPAERPPQYQDALRIAAETMRYCVATTGQLFHAVRAVLEGDEVTVQSFRERLLTTEGVLRQD